MPNLKHPVKCQTCGGLTYRKDEICIRCGTSAVFDPSRLSEEQLMACAEELMTRHKAREEALRAIGMLERAA